VSWIETTLGKSFELYQPKTITTKDLIEDGKYQVYGANGVIGRYDKFNHEEPQLLVTCRGATCGAVNVSSPYAWINGNAMVVKPKSNDIDVRFIEYFFRGAVDLSRAITGAAQPQITRQSLSPIVFKYPSLSVQKKIISKLDLIFSEIEKAMSIADANAKNAEALFQSYLSQIFQNSSADWKKTTLDMVCKITNGSTPKRDNLKYWEGGTVSWFTIDDIRRFGRVITETTQHVTQFALEDTSLKILPSNSVVLCCTASVGEYAIIKKEMATNQQFNGLTVTDKNLLPEFLFWYSATMKPMLMSVSGKVTIDFIPISRLKSLQITFPNLEKQLEIIEKLNCLDFEIKKVKEKYLKKKNQLFLLKQAILKKAFNGELVKE